MDRLHSMRVFSRVVDQGSFAAAARELNLSPAVVTRLVAELEALIGLVGQQPRDELEGDEIMVPPFLRELTFLASVKGGAEAPAEAVTLVPKRSALSTIHTDTMYAAALAGLGITGLPSFVA